MAKSREEFYKKQEKEEIRKGLRDKNGVWIDQ